MAKQEGDRMMKWEYMVVEVHQNVEKREFAFNHLGQQGWELVSVDEGIAYFKKSSVGRNRSWLK